MIAIVVIGLAIGFIAVPLIFMFLWNYIAPLFGGPQINFFHALAIIIFLSILAGIFKSEQKKV
jgi:hypothetical protein